MLLRILKYYANVCGVIRDGNIYHACFSFYDVWSSFILRTSVLHFLRLLGKHKAPNNVLGGKFFPSAKTGRHSVDEFLGNRERIALFFKNLAHRTIMGSHVGRMRLKVKLGKARLAEARFVVGNRSQLAQMNAIVNGLHFVRIHLFLFHDVTVNHPPSRSEASARLFGNCRVSLRANVQQGIHTDHQVDTFVRDRHTQVRLFENVNILVCLNLFVLQTGLVTHLAGNIATCRVPHKAFLPETTQEATISASHIKDTHLGSFLVDLKLGDDTLDEL
mmetsp:Transcript_23749/g.45200  ORF Transcript_23749/g.45200 Transcript_23749/m.45200 type:complete len:275 (+) Transcript_23749:42-866(+)